MYVLCLVVLCGAEGQVFKLVLLDKQGNDKNQEVDHARLEQPYFRLNQT